jgi:outer membrane protein TolC
MFSLLLLLSVLQNALAQQAVAQQTAQQLAASVPQTAATITLQQAIALSTSNEPAYASAVADNKVAQAQRGIARAALLPNLTYHNQFVYTQPLHLDGKNLGAGGSTVAAGTSTPRFIANNTVHEYVSLGVATESVSAAGIADLRRTYAEAAVAKARLEVARRGLVVSIVTAYYSILADDEKLAVAQRALDEATRFDGNTNQREQAGEVAHADSLKSRLQVQAAQRALGDAKVAAEKARLDLAVLLFPDPLQTYSVAGDLNQPQEMPTLAEIAAAANLNNPDMKAAMASFHAASLELVSSRLDYLPTLVMNYNYGIDADHFAVHAPDGTRNLGYAATATLDIPVFDWFATHERAKQSAARRDLAKVELTVTQRQLVASIEQLYNEAAEAREQLTSLDASVRDATEALRLSNLRYTSGEAPILEVVDAQNTLIAVQNSRAEGAARYAIALADLQTLTGKLP